MRPIHWHRYPYLFLVIPLISGILASEYLTFIPSRILLYALIGLPFLLFCLSRVHQRKWFCGFAILFFFLSGTYCHRPPDPSFTPGKVYTIEGRCDEIIPPDKAVISSNGIRVFTQYRDSVRFSIGDSLALDARLYPLTPNGNLHEFDYNTYLRHQNIQARGIPLSLPRRTGHSEDIRSFCHSLQASLLHKLAATVPDSTTYNLLAALCLGSRQSLAPDTKQLFQDTGTIHLLAISGLHIGAIYLLLLYGLRLLGLRNRGYTLVLIPLLWLITGITGLSPSACRAATILSFIIIGKAFLLDHVPLNAIAAAAFFTLLVQPGLLYSVSFQMSYAAYTGITLIYPLTVVKKKNLPSIVRKVYTLLCLSFSAQTLTIPVMAFHFHVISLNSILFNLVAVPIATLLLYLGIGLLALPTFIGTSLAIIATSITHALLHCLRLFSRIAINLPNLYPTIFHISLIYAIALLAILHVTTRQRRVLQLLCGTACLFVMFTCGYTFYRQNRQEVVIYNRYRFSSILLNYKGYYTFLKNTDDPSRQFAYTNANGLQPLTGNDGFIGKVIRYASNQLHAGGRTITIADRLHPKLPEQGILIITENIYPHPETPTMSYPSQIILDQSNSPRCLQAWDDFCRQKQIPLFKTKELGSIVIPLE